MSAAFARRLREIDLSIPQGDVLMTLIGREGLSQQDLAEALHVTKGNISGLIDRLTTAALVERRSIKSDRRTHAIHLTTEGRRLAATVIAIQKAFAAQTLGRLTPEQLAQMDALIDAMQDIILGDETGSARETAPLENT
jgi:DNA-binding MarR family transcriptional regulator